MPQASGLQMLRSLGLVTVVHPTNEMGMEMGMGMGMEMVMAAGQAA